MADKEGMHTEILHATPAELDEQRAVEQHDEAEQAERFDEAEQAEQGGEFEHEGLARDPEVHDADAASHGHAETDQHDAHDAYGTETETEHDAHDAYGTDADTDAELDAPAGETEQRVADAESEGMDDVPAVAPVETGNRWSGDQPVSTEGQVLAKDPSQPEAAPLVVVADPESSTETAAAAGLPKVLEPMLTDQAEQGFLTRWNEIQVSFVEDPQGAVENAHALIGDIAAEYQRAVDERRNNLAGEWKGTKDTEALRLALRSYRGLVGVLLPKK